MRVSKHLGIKFIRDYEAGKYGGGIRADCKALMYAQMLDMDTEEKVFKCHAAFDRSVLAVSYLEPIAKLKNCWINQQGRIYYVSYGAHILVAEHVFLQKEEVFETTHAKIRECSVYSEDPMKYVKKPSKLMARVVVDVLDCIAINK